MFCFSHTIFAVNNVTSLSAYRGVPTFECIGLYCTFAGDSNANSVCSLYYKISTGSTWITGLPLWRCDRDKEYRGSLVNLSPATTYSILLKVKDIDGVPTTSTAQFQVTTWSNTFPEGQKISVNNQSASLTASNSGTASGYTVYRPALGMATIDVNNAADYCINITGDYIIIGNFKLTGAGKHGINIAAGCHDIVIENCEITNWGPAGNGGLDGWDYSNASGIYGADSNSKIIIQSNKIHSPRGDANYWGESGISHPSGPQAISFVESEGNIVIRYNACYSDSAHCYNDCIGGGANYGKGAYQKDSDIYGNIISYAWDEALELDSWLINDRIWGNIFHHTFVDISTAHTASPEGILKGPAYFWRNIMCDSWKSGIGYPYTFKLTGLDGALYYFNNTLVYPKAPANGFSVKGLTHIVKNITAYNNIFHVSGGAALDTYIKNEPTHFFDYDCYQADPLVNPLWETHKVIASLIEYDTSKGAFQYFPKSGMPVINKGCVIPNFMDSFVDTAPDMGALEFGGDTLRIGPQVSYDRTGFASQGNIIKKTPFSLKGFPNPFATSTVIRTNLVGAKAQAVEIFSLSGTLLRTLPLKEHSTVWDGRDNKGKNVSTGIYFIHLVNGEKQLRGKLVKIE